MLSPRRIVGRAKAALVWSLVRRRATGADPAGVGLARIRAYIPIAEGLERPDYASPMQGSPGYLAGLGARPWHDPAQFPGCRRLEETWEGIRDEALALDAAGRFRRRSPVSLSGTPLYDRGSWRTSQLSILGQGIEENRRLCPATTAVVDSIAERSATGHVYFSALEPGTVFHPHCGETNVRLRVHLGLVVPPGCVIAVGGEARPWQEGRCLVMDNSFENHARNEGSATCHALVVDVWHPELTALEISALEEIMRLSRAAAAARRHAGRIARDG